MNKEEKRQFKRFLHQLDLCSEPNIYYENKDQFMEYIAPFIMNFDLAGLQSICQKYQTFKNMQEFKKSIKNGKKFFGKGLKKLDF